MRSASGTFGCSTCDGHFFSKGKEVEDKDEDDYPARFAGSVNKPRRN